MKTKNEGKNLKIFKNKFFIVALSISIIITILCSALSVMGEGNIVKNSVNTISTPFRYVVLKIKEGFEGFGKYFSNIEELYMENSSLRDKISSLEAELEAQRGASDENERLRKYLGIVETHPNISMLEAMITGSSGENFITFLTLNKGSGDGVELGMPIINEQGLIGNVCEVGFNWCRVRVVSEASSGVGAYVKRSGEVGVLSGIVPNKDGVSCVLEYLDENVDIEVGDSVYTSGIGSSYPRDIYIGKITSVEIDKYQRTKVATVECAVNAEGLEYVMIITGYEIFSGDEKK